MKNKITNKIFIYAFLFLYALVAFISFCHAIEFFDIGNTHWMSIMLAFAFELGLAVCLASILIGTNKRNNIAWVLLTLLVIVQVVGNTYSVFKYISESQVDYYNYLAKPLLFWIQEVSEETVQIIVSWIMGAILPIVALLMTEMVANGIKETQDEDTEKEQIENKTVLNEVIDEPINNVKNVVDEPITQEANIEQIEPETEDSPDEDLISEQEQHNDYVETETHQEPVTLESVNIDEPIKLKKDDSIVDKKRQSGVNLNSDPSPLDKANAEKVNPMIDKK